MRDRDRDRDWSAYRMGVSSGGGGIDLAAIARLATNAALIIDFARGSTIPYTTASGTTVTTDTGFVRSIACEKAPAGAGTRIVRDADQHLFQNNGTDNIKGAGVLRSPGNITAFTGATGNTDPSDYMATGKWWFCWHGRMAGTSSDISTFYWGLPSSDFRLYTLCQPSTGTIRIVVDSGSAEVNRDFVVTTGAIFRIAAYFDGTDLHIWVNDLTRNDYSGTGGLGSYIGNPNWFRCQTDKTLDLAALWVGKLDDNNAAQHMADIATWLAYKA